jgi:hypothetical protein
LPSEIYCICLQHFHRVTPVAFIFQIHDSLVKSVQFLLQFLNFVLNRETPSRIFINGLSLLCKRCREALGVEAAGASVDIADGAALKSWIANVAREFGGIDMLFSNAGAMAQGGDLTSWV